MPRGRTRSQMNLSQRRERAMALFVRGFNNTDVAREIDVTPDTVARYRTEYEDIIQEQTRQNPRLLIDVLKNTNRALVELEEVRKSTWREYEGSDSAMIRQQALKTLVSINDQRAKLFGLFGVKQEYFIHVQNIQQMQNQMLEWMRQNLCATDRSKLEEFIRAELSEYMGGASAPAIEIPALEASNLPAG